MMPLDEETRRRFAAVSPSWDGWPLTIVTTRFMGLWEAGRFAAFPLYPDMLPPKWADKSDDGAWWYSTREHALPIGVGETPDEALAHLRALTAATPQARRGMMKLCLEEKADAEDGLRSNRGGR